MDPCLGSIKSSTSTSPSFFHKKNQIKSNLCACTINWKKKKRKIFRCKVQDDNGVNNWKEIRCSRQQRRRVERWMEEERREMRERDNHRMCHCAFVR